MRPAERGWAAVAAVLLGALAGGLLWYALHTDWRTLYTNLDPEDARQISQILAQAQISFEATPDGAGILVPAPQLDKARPSSSGRLRGSAAGHRRQRRRQERTDGL